MVAVSFNTLDCPAGPLVGRHRAFSTNVITRPAGDGGEWRIVATHNTLVTT